MVDLQLIQSKIYEIRGHKVMTPPYIQVITKKNRKHAWKYIIDLVAPKEYDKLVEAIKSKGVIVDNENLVNWN